MRMDADLNFNYRVRGIFLCDESGAVAKSVSRSHFYLNCLACRWSVARWKEKNERTKVARFHVCNCYYTENVLTACI